MKPILLLLTTLTSLSFCSWPIDSVLARADSCIQISWNPTTANTDLSWYSDNGVKCTGTDSKYKSCDFIPGTVYRGIAYSYGGEDTPVAFRKRLALGLAVGSHLCHYQTFGDPTPAVAGTDCSGFLCFAWNVPRTSTNGLVASYPIIARSEIVTGDALVKPGNHAVLVADATNLKQAVIMESTSAVNSCRERVVNLTDSYWSGYTPIRNPKISRSTPVIHRYSAVNKQITIAGARLTIPRFEETVQVSILTMNGSVLFCQLLPAMTHSLTLPNLSAGVYVIQIKSGIQTIHFSTQL